MTSSPTAPARSAASAAPASSLTAATPFGLRRLLLALGIVGPLFYVGSDMFLGTRWLGYSFADQEVSELFAIDAPTRPVAVPLIVTYGLLAIAFGLGVWGSAGPKRALRVVAGALIAKEIFGVVATVITPMHMRGVEGTLTDNLHGILTMLGAVCYLLAMGFGATSFGKRFRLYSIGTMLFLVVGGSLAGMDIPQLGANLPTPWMGLYERVNIYVTMLWIAVLAISLLRLGGTSRPGPSEDARR